MLTDAKIASLKPPAAGRLEVPDKLVPGLRVRVGPSGAKSFTLRARIAGRPANITLGRYPAVTLAKARDAARGLLVEIAAGRDPTAEKAARRQQGVTGADSFAVWWQRYLDRAVRGKLRSAAEIEKRGTRHILPALGHRRIDKITRAEISRLVEAVTYADPDRPKPREGRHVWQALSAFYAWALPLLDDMPANPARDAFRPPASQPRERVLTDVEIAALWRACDRAGWPFGPGVQLLLLTGQRKMEVFGASWAEIDGDLWTLPAARAKNGRAHPVPLSPQALAVVEKLPRLADGALLFPTGRADGGDRPVSGFTKAVARLAAFMAEEMGDDAEPWTLHDIRRTVATGMQRLGIALPVIEAALNHVSGTRAGIVGVYQRHDFATEKRHALEAWGAEVARIVEGKTADKVVALRGRRG